MTSGPDPGELPGFWGSMFFRHAPILRKGSGKQQQQELCASACERIFQRNALKQIRLIKLKPCITNRKYWPSSTAVRDCKTHKQFSIFANSDKSWCITKVLINCGTRDRFKFKKSILTY